MLRIFLCIVFIGSIKVTKSQSILSVGYGRVDEYSKMSQKLIGGGGVIAETAPHFIVNLSIPSNKNWIYSFNLDIYKGFTSLRLDYDTKNTIGCACSQNYRIDLGLGRDLLSSKPKIVFMPFINIGLQFTSPRGKIYPGAPINGPLYFQKEISSESYKTIQLTPSFSIKTGVVIRKKIHFGLLFQGVYAVKTYQKIHFEYYYAYDNPQIIRSAVTESTGTGVFSSIYLGFEI